MKRFLRVLAVLSLIVTMGGVGISSADTCDELQAAVQETETEYWACMAIWGSWSACINQDYARIMAKQAYNNSPCMY